MQKNSSSNFFLKKKSKQYYQKLNSIYFVNKIVPFKSFLPSVNIEDMVGVKKLFEVERQRIADLALLAKQKKLKEHYSSYRWDLKVIRLVFIQFLAGVSATYHRWITSKYAPARWKAAFNLPSKVPKWLDAHYDNFRNKFVWKNPEKFKKISEYFPILTEGIRSCTTLEYLNRVLPLDPIYKLKYDTHKKFGGKPAKKSIEKIKFKKLTKLPKEYIKNNANSAQVSNFVEKKTSKKSSKIIKKKIVSQNPSKLKKKTPAQLRTETLVKSAKRKKFPIRRAIFKTFKHFYIFFKQQQWLAALFSVFNKNGRKKVAINYYLNIIIFLKKKFKKSSTFFVPLYFNQVMMNVMPWFGFRTVVKKRKRYRYPYVAFSDNSVQRFRQNKQLSIKWIKLAIFHPLRTELTIFLKLWSVLQITRTHRGWACFLRHKYQKSFLKKKGWLQLRWAARWI